jgi:predicted transcriptional regulator
VRASTADSDESGFNYLPARHEFVSEDVDLAALTAMLDDEVARTALTATSEEPMSASELADVCDASLPTVYRRVERLEELGLLTEHTRPRRDGHHDTVYLASLERVEVELTEGRLECVVERTERDPADALASLWEKF